MTQPQIGVYATEVDWGHVPSMCRELKDMGCDVTLIAAPESIARHTCHQSRIVTAGRETLIRQASLVLSELSAQVSLDILLPGDDVAFRSLAAVAGTAPEPRVADLLSRSLPPPALADRICRSSRLIDEWTGGPCSPPPSIVSPFPEAAVAFARRHGYPVLVKLDASSGGLGVSPCEDEQALLATLERCKGRSLLVQKFISGRLFGVVVAKSASGAVGFSYLKAETTDRFGPATVVVREHHDDLVETATRLFDSLQLKGFAGVDFIVDDAGRGWLLELNPRFERATPLGRLLGTDVVEAFVSQWDHGAGPARESCVTDAVALFPEEWFRNPKSRWLREAHHAVPWDDPAVVHALVVRRMTVQTGAKLPLAPS